MVDERLDIGQDGFARACGRLESDLANQRSPDVSLIEVLGWMYYLEEVFEQRIGSPDYFARRSQASEGNTLAALIFIRGKVAHALTLVTNVSHLVPSTNLYPSPSLYPGEGWRWVLLDSALPGLKPDAHGRDDLYRTRVEQRDILSPIREGSRFFESLD